MVNASSDDYTPDITLLTAGLYPTWEPRAKSELMRCGLWRLCTGEEILLPIPTLPVSSTTGSVSTRAAAQRDADVLGAAEREYKRDVRDYNDALRRNDRAVGLIRSIIAEDQLQHLDGQTSAKDVWDTLAAKHKDSSSGLNAYYIKIGILEKKYIEDESMPAHLSFLQLENRKLGAKAFDDEFLAQIMLMSLPRDSTWETLVVALLQSITDSHKLTCADVVSRLTQEYRRLTATDTATHAALLAKRRGARSSSATAGSKKFRCRYCTYRGHVEAQCQKKQHDAMTWSRSSTSPSVASSQFSDDSSDTGSVSTSVHTKIASSSKTRSKKWEDGSIHVF
jgi:hypothetical protein